MIIKNIWLNLQLSLFMCVFETSFILNTFHCNFSHFVFKCRKHNNFCYKFLFCLLILNLSFVESLQLDYVMFWWFKPIAFHHILHGQRFSDHKPWLLWSLKFTFEFPVLKMAIVSIVDFFWLQSDNMSLPMNI